MITRRWLDELTVNESGEARKGEGDKGDRICKEAMDRVRQFWTESQYCPRVSAQFPGMWMSLTYEQKCARDDQQPQVVGFPPSERAFF